MRESTTSATPPHKNPSKSWDTATEVKVAPPRAKRPSAAEVNINRPNTTRASSTRKKGASTDLPRISVSLQQGDGYADDCGDYADHPVAHGHFVRRPAERLKVVMERRDEEELTAKNLFPKYLHYV